MKGGRFSDEQIIGVLKAHEAGAATADVRRRHGISGATFDKWKAKFGGLEVTHTHTAALRCVPHFFDHHAPYPFPQMERECLQHLQPASVPAESTIGAKANGARRSRDAPRTCPSAGRVQEKTQSCATTAPVMLITSVIRLSDDVICHSFPPRLVKLAPPAVVP